jgi:hypothetical protein
MLGGDQQHVGAVGRERAAAHWPGDHARQVKHPDTREGAVAGGQRFNGRLADAIDDQ